jgi:hypothetical protein
MGNSRSSTVIVCIMAVASLLQAPAVVSAQTYETVGTRAQGMAGAFTAVSDDATATWWNPAGLAITYFSMVFDRTETTDPPEPPVSGPAAHSRTTAFAAAFPALGLSYYRIRLSEIAPQLTTADGQPGRQDIGAAGVALRSLVTHQFGATVGQSLGNHFVIASSMRLVRAGRSEGTAPGGGTLEDARELDPSLGTRGDLDVGALALLGPARVGVSVKHLSEPEFAEGDARFVFERQVRAGMAWVVGQPGAVGVTAAVDADLTRTATLFGDVRHLAAGGEFRLPRQQLAVRGGISGNTIGDLSHSTTSVGGSVGLSRGFFLDGAATFGPERQRRGWSVGFRLAI